MCRSLDNSQNLDSDLPRTDLDLCQKMLRAAVLATSSFVSYTKMGIIWKFLNNGKQELKDQKSMFRQIIFSFKITLLI